MFLRAERDKRGDGRVYTITATAIDVFGNMAEAREEVTVLDDQCKDDERGNQKKKRGKDRDKKDKGRGPKGKKK